MIGIINMPCESPSEYYAAPPRSTDDGPLFTGSHPNQIGNRQYTPDGKRVGALNQQSQSAESLWAGTIRRSIVYQMGRDQLGRQAVSCCNFSQIVDILDPVPTDKREGVKSSKRKFSLGEVKCNSKEEDPHR